MPDILPFRKPVQVFHFRRISREILVFVPVFTFSERHSKFFGHNGWKPLGSIETGHGAVAAISPIVSGASGPVWLTIDIWMKLSSRSLAENTG